MVVVVVMLGGGRGGDGSLSWGSCEEGWSIVRLCYVLDYVVFGSCVHEKGETNKSSEGRGGRICVKAQCRRVCDKIHPVAGHDNSQKPN
jgi:hypothetical protein